jgi:hypothetical protein
MGKLIVYSLAAWRLAHMLVHERGPLHIFQITRREVGVEVVNEHGHIELSDDHPIFGMFGCTFCMSIWAAALVTRSLNPVKVLAVSAGALAVDRVINS